MTRAAGQGQDVAGWAMQGRGCLPAATAADPPNMASSDGTKTRSAHLPPWLGRCSPWPARRVVGDAVGLRGLGVAATTPAAMIKQDDAPNPRKHFDTPEGLLADPELSNDEKKALLTDWDSELDGQLNAEAEGMGVSDPLSARNEARLADEAKHAKSALTAINDRLAQPE